MYCFSFIHIYGQSDGSLDLTFGQNGKVITNLGWNDVALSVAVQADGKIIVAGLTQDDMGDMDFAVLRYQENGMLDSSFGINGVVITDFGGQDWANSVKLQNDGKILVAGSTYQNYNTDFAICRYHSNGILDYSFGVNGKVTTDFWGFGDEANDMLLQPDGKIVVVGTGGYSNFGIARYNTDGSLDTSFNNTGLVIIDFLNANAYAWTTEIQSDGKIVVAGTSSPTPYNYFAITRLTKNGHIDNSFGINGKVITDFGSQNNFAEAMKIQEDGKIILAGYSYCFPNYSQDFSIVRYNTDGSTDYTFGNNGFVRTDFGTSDYGYSVAIQNDNKIIVAGYSGYPDSSNFAIARYNTFGILDSTFGSFGKVTTNFGGMWDFGFSMILQTDGKIIVAGSSRVERGAAKLLLPPPRQTVRAIFPHTAFL